MKYRAQRVLLISLLAGASACGDDPATSPMPADAALAVDTAPALDGAASSSDAPVAPAPDAASDLVGAQDGGPETTTATDGAAASCVDHESITPAQLRTWLERLTGVQPFAHEGQMVTITERATAPSRVLARAYLRREYQAMGYAVTEPAYDTGINLAAARAGTDPEIVIIGGHYDTVPGVPGADDNASGVVATMAAARALRPCAFVKEMRFLAFDEEEKGGIGARGYARALRDAGEAPRVAGLFNLDMLGHDSDNDGGFVIIDCDRQESLPLTEIVLRKVTALGLGLSARRPCAASGDHRAFWDARIPAIHFGEEFFVTNADDNPCYHRPCDKLDLINFEYLAKLARLAAASAAELAGIR